MVDHLWKIDSLTIDEHMKLDFNLHKDEQIAKTLALFHLAYKNFII
jgi:hypothetical protein